MSLCIPQNNCNIQELWRNGLDRYSSPLNPLSHSILMKWCVYKHQEWYQLYDHRFRPREICRKTDCLYSAAKSLFLRVLIGQNTEKPRVRLKPEIQNQLLLHRRIFYESLVSSDLFGLPKLEVNIRPIASSIEISNIPTLNNMPNKLLNEKTKASVVTGNLGITPKVHIETRCLIRRLYSHQCK